ncbi:helix-turn-helix domain-containing protein [Pseudomonas sp. JS3066]|jgi:AraC family ethanolamine operon transcriptional activator|uniref:helix-turn-helix domain-containing protein n=1 Tax=unclassified Pseudomonas TaxID=196821 RepID=UPI002E7B8E3A|nr:helix-turn-helix domain-containing protein [Pseudomonas sp. JS3066]WVK95463.1 helix-turn-helix domain-containing protein [Pseudomonas sp. JS3066]
MTGIARHQASDSDELAGALAGWNQDYTQLGRGRLHAELLHIQLVEASLIYEHSNLHLHENMTPPQDQVVFGIPLKVSADSLFNGGALAGDTLLVLEGGEEMEICAPGEIGMLGLTVDRRLIARVLGAEEQERLEQALGRRRLDISPLAAQRLREDLCASIGAFERAEYDPRSAEHGVRTVMSSLDCVLQGLDEVLLGPNQRGSALPRTLEQRRRLVLAAVEMMQANLDLPLSMLELCQALNTSHRTLQYCFKQISQATPQQFFLSLRLAEARRRLKQDPLQSITTLALDLGFASSSHFSSLYKRLYGEQPSLTGRRG